ncbi:MMPL family transporter [Nocardia sp. CA-119907]|uniref:MMPL family transporter n=1 Tax=Nocardia sp. CA-119907 TaxID=3239973 RepID=UPI003D990FED
MNRFTRRIGDAAARRPWRTLGGWVAVLGMLLALAGAAGGAFADDFIAPGSQSETAMALLEERFPDAARGTAMAVFAAAPGERLDQDRSAVMAAVARLSEVDHVAGVTDPFAAGTVSADGRIGYADLVFDVPVTELGADALPALAAAMDPARAAGLAAELGGDAAFVNAEAETSGIEVAGLLAAFVVLLVVLGTVVAALAPIMIALTAVAVGLGGIVLLANAMNVSTSAPTIAAMIGLGVGIDYALFIVTRYREHRTAGRDNADALSLAMSSSGAVVAFSGGTVVLAMAALALTGVGLLTSIGLATALVVLIAIAAALTLLPALLALLGDRIDVGRVGRRARRSTTPTGAPVTRTVWWWFAHRVAGRPWPYLVAAGAVLLALAAPTLWMETGFPDAGDDTTEASHRRAYDLLAQGFGPGVNGQLLVVVDLRRAGVTSGGLAELGARIAADPGIAQVGAIELAPAGDAAIIPARPETAPSDPATGETLTRVRDLVPDNVAVSGMTAMTDDLTRQLGDTLPVFVGAILVTSFLLLLIVFRSLVVPLKAVVMNLLSIGGAYGVLVAVFQWGWCAGLFGLEDTYRIASPIPVIAFAVLFGLSMDYEVFLLSRIREEYDATGDNAESVARGISGTGRVITAAALIMTAVFLGFVVNPSPMVTMMGLGLATAILLDATIVRMVLVPATMALLGRANWWLPAWLEQWLPQLTQPEHLSPR